MRYDAPHNNRFTSPKSTLDDALVTLWRTMERIQARGIMEKQYLGKALERGFRSLTDDQPIERFAVEFGFQCASPCSNPTSRRMPAR
jgi:hypothetical protein